jgi:hypothetical protein
MNANEREWQRGTDAVKAGGASLLRSEGWSWKILPFWLCPNSCLFVFIRGWFAGLKTGIFQATLKLFFVFQFFVSFVTFCSKFLFLEVPIIRAPAPP